MAKFQGKIGFMQVVETVPGVHRSEIVEVGCKGDILRNFQSSERAEYLNDDIIIRNRFSVLADAFVSENIVNIRYVLWNGTKWAVKEIEIQRPRLILSIGGVYNG